MDYEIGTNNFDSQLLKFHIQYMSCKYVIQNQTTQTYHFDLYSASHKGLSDDTIFTDFSAGMVDVTQSGGFTSTVASLGVLATQVPSMKSSWNLKRTAFELKPGEKKTLFYKTHNDTLIDFEKLYDDGSLRDFTKLSESLCFGLYPVMNRNYNVAGSVGHFVPDVDPKFGINIEVEEKYVFDAPSTTAGLYDHDSICWFSDFGVEQLSGQTTHQYINNNQVADPAKA